MNMKIFVCIYASLFTLSACSQTDQCSGFPEKLGVPIDKVFSLSDAKSDDYSIIRARKIIERCYRISKFAIDRYEVEKYGIEFRDVKKYKSGYVMSYAFDGISDIQLGFIVSKNGDVMGVFEFSTL